MCWNAFRGKVISRVMIGIDLGTTNSLVAIMKDGTPEVLTNEMGEALTPSAVALAEDGTVLVGRAARDRLVSAPESGKAFFKRDMGTAAGYKFGGRLWTPVECSARILQEMKRIAELRLGQPVTSAVITVPAYFHDPQRQATIEAAKIAGLKVDRLINEPTAAALAYGHRAKGEESTLLVFDLGGGTFDVTLLEIFEGIVEVKASSGESRLGGEDYTDTLADWISREFQWSPLPPDKVRWREQVESLKRKLTRQETGTIFLGEKEVNISRDDFTTAAAELTARLRPVVRRCLRDGGVWPQHLDGVLLVGGASRMPLVIQNIREELGCEPNQTLDPDLVVAMGAAVQQALCSGDEAVRELVLTDVCPHTLGVEVSKQLTPGQHDAGFFSPLIDRNTTVPVSRSDTYHTLHPEQDEIRLKIYQGEGRLTKDNQRIGELAIQGLRHRPGQENPGTVDVRFTYDMNGILEVEVTVLHSGKKIAQVFEQRPGMLTPQEIEAAIARLAPLKVHPRDSMENRARLQRAERLYADLLGGLREQLSMYIDQFEAALTSQDPGRIAATGAELDGFMAPYFSADE